MISSRSRGACTAAAIAAALALAGCGDAAPTPAAGTADLAAGAPVSQLYPPPERTTPQPVTGELLDGTPFDLLSLRGKVVVVNWWGSWCAPCRVETPDLVAAYEATEEEGVAFLGVNVRDTRDAATSFSTDFRVPYPSVFDPAGRVALAFRDVPPTVVPTTVILDRSGRVATAFRKVVTQDELESAIRGIATESGPTGG
ncbi:TlpA family protein disulfide reductase [Spirilliplanes yamanashiensis]|uniref:Putative thioredoxin n=1 Tax=Spirilliplanes yamanashiensis TaxID=42233 RepID=A0A8J3YF66_9ACTN|nr:TlpA disulfide reductase family protein [Spirilliplanes yamanashiensis]MDP9818417.1 thiol-disulfide isomerase/thioredoxin [Spirilliplanes yamanashiensis]GIJ06637.1 putative thioredoxin [Spirilliplanes yamanashiensis]